MEIVKLGRFQDKLKHRKVFRLVLTDPPFGTTCQKWDTFSIPEMWERVVPSIVDDGVVLLHCAEPFTSELIMSNRKMFRYRWTWDKICKPTGFLNSKFSPLRIVEDIAVFSKVKPAVFNQQPRKILPYHYRAGSKPTQNYGQYIKPGYVKDSSGKGCPVDLISFRKEEPRGDKYPHPAKKPIALLEYLIRTYTNKGDWVLDFCMGSGSTGVACINLGRNFVGIESDPLYFEMAKARMMDAKE